MNCFINNCKNSSIILCLYMIPVFLYGTYYRDDHARIASNYYGWDLDGRPLTNIIIKALNFSSKLTDIAPLSQILSIIISSITCGIICSYIIKNNKILTVIAVSLLFINPFFLQNLSYRFDVITMCLSILFAVTPFTLNVNKKLYNHYILSLFCILCLLTTYQASLPVFYACIFLSYLCDKNNRNIVVNISRVICGLISLIIYYFIIAPNYVGGGYAKGRSESINIFSNDFIIIILSNLSKLCINLSELMNHTFFIVFSLVIMINTLIFIKSLNKIKLTLLFILFFSFIMSFLIFFFLKNPVYAPRVMIGINALIMISCVVITLKDYQNRYINIFITTSILIPTIFFFSIATNYVNSSKAYIDYEREVIRSIYYDYNNLKLEGTLYINGYLYPPYITKEILNKIPFLRNIVGSRLGSSTSQLKKTDFPLFDFLGDYNQTPSKIKCKDILKEYNGIYLISKNDNKNYIYLKNIQCF